MFDYSARPDLLQGRVILVTGAGRGIGAAAAKCFAAHGATVLLLGKSEDNLNQVYDQIEAAGHAQPAVIPFNLETALADAYYAACIMYPEQFSDIDPVEKAGEIFTALLGTNPYEDLKEAGYEFRQITIGE